MFLGLGDINSFDVHKDLLNNQHDHIGERFSQVTGQSGSVMRANKKTSVGFFFLEDAGYYFNDGISLFLK